MHMLRCKIRPLLAGTALTLAALSLTGCVVAPVGPYGGPYYGEQTVGVAPPPPQAEVYGPPPAVGYVWIGGFWNWVGGRHVWINGHWSAPRPGYRWAPHRWERGPGGWHQRGGRWER
jgi:WXXGXW repeat (2 copies)